jgi:predicted phage-related endonuclease
MTRPARRTRTQQIARIAITSREQWLELRKHDITASTVGALFGLSPYLSPAQLFAEKTGRLDPDEPDSMALRRGRLLEGAVAEAFLEEHSGWKVTKAHHYYRDIKRRLGATPDYHLIAPDGRKGVLQSKTVAPYVFKKSWTDQTAPTWITLQTLTEAMLTRSDFGMIAALQVDGYKFELSVYEVPRHDAAERRIQDAVAKFWTDAAEGRAPAIDYTRDGALLAAMYPHHREGASIDLRGDNELPELLEEREAIKANVTIDEARIAEIEARLKEKLTDNEIGLVHGWRLTLREQHRKEYTVKPTSFRVLRVVREQEEKAA